MGKFLKLWMKANNLTSTQLARKVKMPVLTLRKYIQGSPIGTKHLLKLSRFTGISCRDLIMNHDRNGELGENNEPWHDEDE